MLSHMLEFPSALRLDNTPLYVETTLYLSIHLLMDTWIAPPLGFCEQCCHEHGYTNIFFSSCFQFFWVYTQRWNAG